MATIIQVKNKGGIVYKAIIRKVGHAPIKRSFPTKREAKAWAAEQEMLITQKRYKDPRLADAITIEELLEKYQKHSAEILKKAPTTIDREKTSKKNILAFFSKETPLSHITTAKIYSYQETRLSSGASASSIRQELSMLSRMFNVARNSWQINIENPVTAIDRVPPSASRERFLSTEEAAAILDTARGISKKFFCYVLLLMHTGMRSREAATLNISNINLAERMVTLWKTKNNKARTVPLTLDVVDAINAIELENNGYLFLTETQRQSEKAMLQPGKIFRRQWETLWRRIKKKTQNKEKFPDFPEIAPFTPHDIRHTAASHLLRQGVDVRIIADILGHSSLSMIMRYTHLFDDSKRKHIDKISYLGTRTDDK